MKRDVAAFFSRQQGTILKVLLSAVFLLFIGILIAVYVVSKQANPIMLDEHGRPIATETSR